ncbi:aminotransferase-like domain-containing protein [Sphingomonas abietis]|uniref:PLP-dependent aminotransferase family protein n=1 Tax=Sphingomonas abietis TaxID=3012344 RepID=A0ABY7NHK4_9SPHN|nr:PLP-dependent aminotransferase family protein [Sphingomonas abietis]WBO20747.1 PLP-dependent aminotransferase family protein [Sphingomonas abietis]
MLVEATDGTLTEQVMALVRTRIERRQLVSGARLPSVRAMAEAAGVSKSTVVEAYDRLVAEGAIRARPGSGFYVAAPLAPLTIAAVDSRADLAIDPLWMLRESLSPRPGAILAGGGCLPDDWLPVELLRKGLRTIARTAPLTSMTNYSTAMGSEPVRRLIARRMGEQGVDVATDQILLTDSGTQAIDLICRFLIEPGDVVLIDDPCYFNFQALLRAHRARPIGVPFTPHGPDVEAFQQALEEHLPRLYITNSAIHNPTGASLSAPVAHRLLKLAEAHDLLIVEDDIFADFETVPSARLAAFDGLDRVIRVGSFSKSLTSAVRCGHIAARRDWIAALADLRIATGMSSSPISAELVHTVLTDGAYRRHMEKIRGRLEQTMTRVIPRLAEIGIVPWIEPSGGMFLWARLPDDLDAVAVTRHALRSNIVLAPGNVFSVSQSAGSYLRLNVARMGDDRVFEVLEAAMAHCGRGQGLAIPPSDH